MIMAITPPVFHGMPMMIPENSICVNGQWYEASGVQECPKLGSWAASDSRWVAQTLDIPVPYEPPEGYGFLYSCFVSNGFTVISTAEATRDGVTRIRVHNYASTNPNISYLCWQLVKHNIQDSSQE